MKFPTLFPGIDQNTTPIKMFSRKYSKDERNFAENYKRLLDSDNIEEYLTMAFPMCCGKIERKQVEALLRLFPICKSL